MLRNKSYKEALIFGESFLKDLNIISLKLDVRLILSKILNTSQIKLICEKQNYLSYDYYQQLLHFHDIH